jgi:hypothetical protein
MKNITVVYSKGKSQKKLRHHTKAGETIVMLKAKYIILYAIVTRTIQLALNLTDGYPECLVKAKLI